MAPADGHLTLKTEETVRKGRSLTLYFFRAFGAAFFLATVALS
jgi:hypothetical protein